MNEIIKIRLKLVGIRPLIMHNGRLANPLDRYAEAIKEFSGKRNKTEENLLDLAKLEYLGSLYETEDGRVGFPVANIFAAFQEASKKNKKGKIFNSSVGFDPIVIPMRVAGKYRKAENLLFEIPGTCFSRLVRVERARVMRTRAMIPEGWELEPEFEVATQEINPSEFVAIASRAGEYVGLGDWRPRYGRFRVEVVQDKKGK